MTLELNSLKALELKSSRALWSFKAWELQNFADLELWRLIAYDCEFDSTKVLKLYWIKKYIYNHTSFFLKSYHPPCKFKNNLFPFLKTSFAHWFVGQTPSLAGISSSFFLVEGQTLSELRSHHDLLTSWPPIRVGEIVVPAIVALLFGKCSIWKRKKRLELVMMH